MFYDISVNETYVYKNVYADNYHVNNYDLSDRILCYPNVLDVGIVFPHQ